MGDKGAHEFADSANCFQETQVHHPWVFNTEIMVHILAVLLYILCHSIAPMGVNTEIMVHILTCCAAVHYTSQYCTHGC